MTILRGLGLGLSINPATLPTGVGASAYAKRPAPNGWRWDFVTSQGVRVTSQNEPVVALVRAA